MGTYIETERLKLRDWEEKDLLPFQKMNANQQVRRYFPSLLSYRRSELDMKKWMKLSKIMESAFCGWIKGNGWMVRFIGVNYIPEDSKYPF